MSNVMRHQWTEERSFDYGLRITDGMVAVDDLQTALGQMEKAYRSLQRELSGITAEEMEAFRLEEWPRSEHWAGQDGSIRGILAHVSAWKEALARALETGEEVDPAALSSENGGVETILDWLEESHAHLRQALTPYVQGTAEWSYPAVMEGMDLARTLAVYSDHDRYHAAQVAYLRERWRATRGA